MQPGIADYYRQKIIPAIRAEILREPDEQIIGTDIEDLKLYYYERYVWAPIEEDPAREANYDIENYLKTIPAHRRGPMYAGEGDLRDLPCQRAVVEVPILANVNLSTISGLIGNTWSMSYSPSDLNWAQGRITYVVETKGYQFALDEDQIAREVEQALKRIREEIGYRNAAIKSGNAELLHTIFQTISERRQKIEEDKARISALTKKISIPLKKKTVAGAEPVRLSERPIVSRIKPKPSLPEEYVLDAARVSDLVNYIDSHARNFEKTPDAVSKLGEEDLRDLILANLNSIFQGDATGETFSKSGKTDIHLRISKGDILISECKIWGGRALYAKTIDQLRGYLTWRQNHGIMVTFVRAKGFSKVLEEAAAAIQEHSSYMGGFKKIGESHFVSNHRVDDDDKQVCIHHLFYHLA